MVLDALQARVFEDIAQKTREIKMRVHRGEDVAELTERTAGYALALYRDLAAGGNPPQFTKTMLARQNYPTTDVRFFEHLNSLEDFCRWVQAAQDAGEPADPDAPPA